MTRFSVLLPTRNGGRLLGPCIEAVLAQEHESFELIVSDNANVDETAEVLKGCAGDPRLVVLRQDQLLSVTDNWRAALDAASGDYLLMIGDDDLLLPGSLAALDAALAERGQPECLTFNAVRYVAPDALEGVSSSWYGAPYFEFDERVVGQRELTPALRRELVAELFDFRLRFPLTMQLTLVSRTAAGRLRRGLFNSPFPDHYAIGSLLLTAHSWAMWDGAPVVVGVSVKSFGQYFFNRRDSSGMDYLGVQSSFGGHLPGNEVTNATAAWLLELGHDYADLLGQVRLSRPEYVARHLIAWLVALRAGQLRPRDVIALARRLSARDAVGVIGLAAAAPARRQARDALHRMWTRGQRSDPLWASLHELPEVYDITEFARWWTAGRTKPGATEP